MGGVGGTTPFLHTYHEPSGSKQPCCDRAALSEAKIERGGEWPELQNPFVALPRTPLWPYIWSQFTDPPFGKLEQNIGPGMVGVGWLGAWMVGAWMVGLWELEHGLACLGLDGWGSRLVSGLGPRSRVLSAL